MASTIETHKHPTGGRLTIDRWPNGLGIDVVDTRKLARSRRSVRASVRNCGRDGWEVVLNPGENYRILGVYPTATADAAYEFAITEHEL